MSTLTNRMYSDEYLERWTQVYEARHLRARGILLETFLEAPEEILAAVTYWRPARLLPGPVQAEPEFRPLLPRQLAVAMRLRRQEGFGRLCEAVEVELQRRIEREHVIGHGGNGAQCEVLRHRRHVPHRRHNTLFVARSAPR